MGKQDDGLGRGNSQQVAADIERKVSPGSGLDTEGSESA
jgi:hypothetical protein